MAHSELGFLFGFAELSCAFFGGDLSADTVVARDLKDQMNHIIGAIYHILLKSQYGIWTINL